MYLEKNGKEANEKGPGQRRREQFLVETWVGQASVERGKTQMRNEVKREKTLEYKEAMILAKPYSRLRRLKCSHTPPFSISFLSCSLWLWMNDLALIWKIEEGLHLNG